VAIESDLSALYTGGHLSYFKKREEKSKVKNKKFDAT